MITIQPWDVSQIGPIEKAIRTSDLGLNPANDGKMIRLPIPPLTEERRKEIVKKTARRGGEPPRGRAQHPARWQRSRQEADEGQEDHRGRREAALDEIQKMTDAYMQKIDLAVKTKEKEILEIR